MNRGKPSLWTNEQVIQKFRLHITDPVLGQQMANRVQQLLQWAGNRGVSVQDPRRSTSGNIRFYVGNSDIFHVCAWGEKSKDLHEDAIWIQNTGRFNPGIAHCEPFDDVKNRLEIMHRLRDGIAGTDNWPRNDEKFSDVNPYLWLKLLVPDEAFAAFVSVYDDIVNRIS